MRYRTFIFKSMINPIPDVFVLYYKNHKRKEDIKRVNKDIQEVLNGNAAAFMDETGKLHTYDRNIIRKIIVKPIED